MAVQAVHPELFRFELLGGSRPVFSYGVLVAAGIAAGLGIAVSRARRYGVARYDELGFGLIAVAGGLAGAALLDFALHLGFHSPGLVFFGGLAGGALAALAYCRCYAIDLGCAADAAVPGLLVGQAIGRVGCLLGG